MSKRYPDQQATGSPYDMKPGLQIANSELGVMHWHGHDHSCIVPDPTEPTPWLHHTTARRALKKH